MKDKLEVERQIDRQVLVPSSWNNSLELQMRRFQLANFETPSRAVDGSPNYCSDRL